MNEFLIRFVGIVFFYVTPVDGVNNARQAYLIDARAGRTYAGVAVEPHVPHIRVESAFVDKAKSTWTADEEFTTTDLSTPVSLFVLRGDTITVAAEDSQFDPAGHDAILPRVSDWCPGWSLDLPSIPIAGRIDITKGKLIAIGDIREDEPVETDWTVHTSGNLTITATARDGSKKVLSIKPGIKIFVGNETNLMIKDPTNPHHEQHRSNHFLLFYSIGTRSDRSPCDVALFPGAHALRNDALSGRNCTRNVPSPLGKNFHADCSNSSYP